MSYFTDEQGDAKVGKLIGNGILGLIIIILLFGSMGIVSAGEKGVKTRLGKVVGTVDTGLYFKLPFFESVHKIDVRTRVIKNEHYVNTDGEVVSNNPLDSASKDLQDVQVSIVVNYQIDPNKVVEIYTQYKTEEAFEEGVIKPLIKQEAKNVTSQYTAEELVTKRAEYNDRVSTSVAAAVATKSIILQQTNVTNIGFSQSFNSAIEAKVTAEQQALTAKNKLEQVKYEAQQQIETAKATAEAQRISSAALAAQGGEDYVQLKAIEKWDGHLPQQMIPGSSVPFINVNK